MSKQNLIGKKGEDLAKDFLRALGYQILETNWRFGRAEIDIIARIDGILVFVEVKTRSYEYFGAPETSITPRKELLISEAAAAYMREIEHQWEFRFDVVSVVLHKGETPALTHYEDAFFPGL